MKWFKRLKVWKRANLVYDPETGKGYSYKWYRIADRMHGFNVINTYGYSVTTAKHACELRRIAKFDLEIKAPKGLQDLHSSKEYYEDRIKELTTRLNSPRTRKKTKTLLIMDIDQLDTKMNLVQALIDGNVNQIENYIKLQGMFKHLQDNATNINERWYVSRDFSI